MATIAGTIYDDTNGDDAFSDGEGRAGVTVAVYRFGFNSIYELAATAITDADGRYSLTLPASSIDKVVFSGGGLPSVVQFVVPSVPDADSFTLNLIDGSTLETSMTALNTEGLSTIIALGTDAITVGGGDGSQTLIGHAQANGLNGLAGADVMRGRGGNDWYVVDDAGDIVDESDGTGIDSVYSSVDFSLADTAQVRGRVELLYLTGEATRGIGNSLSNRLVGNGSDNVLKGMGGNDRLTGRGGDDILQGGAGNDILAGEYGKDILTGGAGADTFDFDREYYSTVAVAGRDWIVDFNHGEGDRIDLSGMDADKTVTGNQEFAFIGRSAFTGQAGEVRYSVISGKTVVYADTDGDRTADFSIGLSKIEPLVAGDFIL